MYLDYVNGFTHCVILFMRACIFGYVCSLYQSYGFMVSEGKAEFTKDKVYFNQRQFLVSGTSCIYVNQCKSDPLHPLRSLYT